MKLSTKGRYGVAAMYELALHYGEGPISLKSIAQKQGISEHYLEQLICTLRNSGYVTSIRGAQGGYILAKDPKGITVGDIIIAMEGPIALVDCLLDVYKRQGLFPSPREYARIFGLNKERLSRAKDDVLVLHPGPMNRGLEISPDVAYCNHSAIQEQVQNGVAIRMALLTLVPVSYTHLNNCLQAGGFIILY